MKKQDKGVLATIIILLVIMVPITTYSVYLKFNYKAPEVLDKPAITAPTGNEKYVDGKLYFYDKNNKAIGTYTCKSEDCSYSTSTIDDNNYSIEYLKNEEQDIDIINNRYAFIEDDASTLLYDISEQKVLETYRAVKNYNNMLAQGIMIVQNLEEKWGVIKLDESLQAIIPLSYDYIGVVNTINPQDNKLDSILFVVKSGDQWAILDDEAVTMSNYLSYEITNYNDMLISVKNTDGVYYLYDFNGKRAISVDGFNYISFMADYAIIVDLEDKLYLYDSKTQTKLGPDIQLTTKDYKNAYTIKLDERNNKIKLTIDGQDYDIDITE